MALSVFLLRSRAPQMCRSSDLEESERVGLIKNQPLVEVSANTLTAEIIRQPPVIIPFKSACAPARLGLYYLKTSHPCSVNASRSRDEIKAWKEGRRASRGAARPISPSSISVHVAFNERQRG